MFDIEKMLERDKYFCEFFTNKEQRDYGILYYNTDNPLSYDSNHAHILDLDHNVEAAIRDIITFYQSRNLMPRVYCSFVDNELDILRNYFPAHGFNITTQKYTYYRFNPAFLPIESGRTACRRISKISREIIDLIYSDENGGEWTVKVLQKHIHDPSYHLLGRFHRERLVAMASVKTQDGYSRVDDVITRINFRGRHFGTDLMKYLVTYHNNISDNYLYLYADNPIAIRMYQNVGFEEIHVQKPNWSAYLEG
jgi:GNAT superfamily N-acetyltransferase